MRNQQREGLGEIERRTFLCCHQQWSPSGKVTNKHARRGLESKHFNIETVAQHQGVLALIQANARQTLLLLMRGPDRNHRIGGVEQMQRRM